MKLNSKLLFIAALIALVIPLIFAGNSSAQMYTGDGAIHDNTTTAWKLPAADGVTNGCLADPTKTNSRACNAVKFPAYTDDVACSASQEFTDGKVEWSTSSCSVSLENHDRNALICEYLGGTTSAACQGHWTDVPAVDTRPGSITGNECLRCHSSTIQRNGYVARWKDTYVKTGHKNMLRKVSSGAPWAGPDGVVYATDGSGNHIDWANATVTRTDLTPSDRALYYIYGDWMAPGVSTIYDNSAAGDGSSAKYTCASCHTTGYEPNNFVTTKEPYLSYPGITAQITGSWDMNGIQCSRCHNAGTITADTYRESLGWGSLLTFGTHNESAAGAEVNSLCIECHNSTQDKADPAGQLKTAASGQGFSGHIIGNQFLNSTHARFTGTSGQVSNAANYGSTHFRGGDEYNACRIFKTGVTSSSGQLISEIEAKNEAECAALVTTFSADSYQWNYQTQGNCATCHDVHQSIVPEVGAAEPLRRECKTCHTGAYDKDIYKMMHPTTPGTPGGFAEAAGEESEACVICHMAVFSPEGSTHLPPHLWRINTSASYNTFPTSAEWSAGTKIANTMPDGTYTNAVWVDLDMACGQCHGGSAGPYATQNGAPYMSKAYLAAIAGNMHQDAQVPPVVTAKPAITVDLGTPLNNVRFTLQKCGPNGCSTKETAKADDTYTFKARKPGDYKVKVYKKGIVFDCEGTGKKKVMVTTVDADVTVTCTHTP